MTVVGGTYQSQQVNTGIKNMIIIIFGVVIILLHVWLLIANKSMFLVLISIYTVIYTILIIVFNYKKRSTSTNREYSFILYLSMFILAMEISLLIFSLSSLLKKDEYMANSRYR